MITKGMRAAYCITIAYITVFLLLAGCSGLAKRSPEQWLSLSYAGLTGVDHYEYTGSLQITAANGIQFVPQTFEGKVVDHQQLMVQTSSSDPLLMNPVKVLERISRSGSRTKVMTQSITSDTVTLQIEEEGEEAKEQWSELLRQQLKALSEGSPIEDSAYKREWDKELADARARLEAILGTLQAQTSYELIIDRNRLLPMKLEEHTTFIYDYNGKSKSENRHTSVRFQSFDGSASKAVQ